MDLSQLNIYYSSLLLTNNKNTNVSFFNKFNKSLSIIATSNISFTWKCNKYCQALPFSNNLLTIKICYFSYEFFSAKSNFHERQSNTYEHHRYLIHENAVKFVRHYLCRYSLQRIKIQCYFSSEFLYLQTNFHKCQSVKVTPLTSNISDTWKYNGFWQAVSKFLLWKLWTICTVWLVTDKSLKLHLWFIS